MTTTREQIIAARVRRLDDQAALIGCTGGLVTAGAIAVLVLYGALGAAWFMLVVGLVLMACGAWLHGLASRLIAQHPEIWRHL